MRYRILSILIVAFWATMMFHLVVYRILEERRREANTFVSPEILSHQWEDIQEWMWVRRGGRRLGAMVLLVLQRHQAAATHRPPGYIVIQNGRMDLPILGFTQNVQFRMTLHLDPRFHVERFVATAQLEGLAVEVDGFVVEQRLYYRIWRPGSEPRYYVARLAEPISLGSALQPMLTRHMDMQVGDAYTVDLIDPFGLGGGQDVEIAVAARESVAISGETYEAYRLDATYGNITRSTWIEANPRRRTLRREVFQGITLDVATKPGVLEAYPDLGEPLSMPRFDAATFSREAASAEQSMAPLRTGLNVMGLLESNAPRRPTESDQP